MTSLSLVMVVCGGVILLLLARRRSIAGPGSALRTLLTWVAWSLVGLGVFQICTFGTFLGAVLGLCALVLLAMAISQYRASQRNIVLWSLATASRRGVPLSVPAKSLAAKPTRWLGERADLLFDALSGGVMVGESLRASGLLKNDDDVSRVMLGDELGLTEPALRAAAASSDQRQPLLQAVANKLFYGIFVLWVFAIVTTFMVSVIVPAFVKIFDDFEQDLPYVAQSLFDLADTMNDSGIWYLLLPAYLISVVLTAWLVLRYMGWIQSLPPLIRRLSLPLHRASILGSLAVVVQHDKSLTDALTFLGKNYPRRFVRRRLQRAAAAVQQGETWQHALRHERLLVSADAAVLAAAERVGNLSWAMNEMAGSTLRRYHYRVNAWLHVGMTLFLLLVGMGVLWVAAAVFQSLTKIITSLL